MEHVITRYDLARGLHIIAVIAWVAGLLMLPRFYAHITASTLGGELEQTMLKASAEPALHHHRPHLWCWPAAFGIYLFANFIVGDWNQSFTAALATVPHWFWAKLGPGAGPQRLPRLPRLSIGRRLAAGERELFEKFWRLMSEVPFLVAIGVVLLATLEPR